MKPFRWDLEKCEQLGRLTQGQRSAAYPGFVDDLRACASRVVAMCAGGRLVFVGRSPESLFDYLSGICADTSWRDRLAHLNISNRWRKIAQIEIVMPGAIDALKAHFEAVGVSPDQMIANPLKTSFTDLVSEGDTFGRIAEFLVGWNAAGSNDQAALRHKLRLLGIISRTKTSPNTWRWFQHAEWIGETGIDQIANVSAKPELWGYLGNDQAKVTASNTPESWASDSLLLPPRDQQRIEALRRARDLYERGRAEKRRFAELLAQSRMMAEAWLRDFVNELR
jgi:hypothetical protein